MVDILQPELKDAPPVVEDWNYDTVFSRLGNSFRSKPEVILEIFHASLIIDRLNLLVASVFFPCVKTFRHEGLHGMSSYFPPSLPLPLLLLFIFDLSSFSFLLVTQPIFFCASTIDLLLGASVFAVLSFTVRCVLQ